MKSENEPSGVILLAETTLSWNSQWSERLNLQVVSFRLKNQEYFIR